MCEDRKSATLDAGNVKLTYNSLLEKAEAKERERLKEETKKLRKLESAFRSMLRDANVDHSMSWSEAKSGLEQKHEYRAVPSDAEREKMYKDYQREMEEACSHHHSGRGSRKAAKRAKKAAQAAKKHRNGKSSESEEESDKDRSEIHQEVEAEPKRRARTPSSERTGSDTAVPAKKKKSKKSKYKRRSPSLTPPPIVQEIKAKSEKKKGRNHSDDSNADKDLSETELEKQRALLLAQLKDPEYDD